MIAFSITDWYETLSSYEQLFWVIAIASTGIFVIQVVIALIGFDAESEGMFDSDSIDGGFSLISFRTILSFLVCFGWIGLVTLYNGGSIMAAFIWGSLAGLGAMILVAYLLYQLIKMNESGTVDISKLINHQGEVYVTIPSEGNGLITIEVERKLMEFEAKSIQGEIKTGTQIRIIEIHEGNLMIVEPIN